MKSQASFDEVSRFNAFSQADNDDLYLCGEWQPNELEDGDFDEASSEFKAVVARIDDYNDLDWIVNISGPRSDPLYPVQDKCMGIAYDNEREQVAVLIQSKMSLEDVVDPFDDQWNSMLVLMDRNADIDRVTVLVQDSINVSSMFASPNGLLWQDENLFFAGFGSSWNKNTVSTIATETDAYVYKYQFDQVNGCLNWQDGGRDEFRTSKIDIISS